MKKNVLKKMVLMSCLILTMTSCNELFYQVYTLESNQVEMKNNSVEYSNKDCRVSYNFWSNGGQVAFMVENLTDNDMFINMNESFLVVNGFAHNYFEGKTYSYGASGSVGIGYSENLGVSVSGKDFWEKRYLGLSAGVSANVSTKASVFNSVTQKEQEVICIPAHSFKLFSKFNISPDLYIKCDKKVDFPNGKVSAATFAHENSPLKINNRLTYGFDKNIMDKHIDNVFWLSEIENYSEKSAIDRGREKGCYDSYDHKVKHFKIGNPSKFYRDYIYTNVF